MLLVEDNPGDVRLTREAIDDAGIDAQLHVVTDGLEAIKFLRNEDDYTTVSKPDLILLDLNLPKLTGKEVLQIIKSDTNLKSIPVVMLTTSLSESDVMGSYDAHANCYINKPVDLDQFYSTMKSIQNFWLSTVVLPTMLN